MTEKSVSVHTSLGDLVAVPFPEGDYPSICIYLQRGERRMLLAAVEEDMQAGKLQVLAYPEGDDEPDIAQTFANLDRAFDEYGFVVGGGANQ